MTTGVQVPQGPRTPARGPKEACVRLHASDPACPSVVSAIAAPIFQASPSRQVLRNIQLTGPSHKSCSSQPMSRFIRRKRTAETESALLLPAALTRLWNSHRNAPNGSTIPGTNQTGVCRTPNCAPYCSGVSDKILSTMALAFALSGSSARTCR